MTTEIGTTVTTRAVVIRAKEIFCQHYNYPKVRFASIGRKCWADCLRVARINLQREAEHAARLARMSDAERAERVESLNAALELAPMADSWQAVVSARASIMAELRILGAA